MVNMVTTGGHFGELALEHKLPRTASVYTKTECDLAVITYEKYQILIL
jgi:CRP-like cAMP-binding protein